MTVTAVRNADLRDMLSERRRAIQNDLKGRIRNRVTDRGNEVGDELEHSDADVQGDIDVAMLQMRADTVTRIDEALARLGAGKYGSCFECAAEISEPRLRALPFAVRCQACEQRREQEVGRTRHHRRGSVSLFADAVGY